ncbi:hypothetical protein HMPREF9336_02794 [Segniliparus rugosus ATCC BAA-974]|uniref:Lipoprotein LpqN n=2 Tax=Segniliparus rugosus TaxID=286804 RepID=E5XTH2_SEGRC|nr:hypothetical protein HMPREF9336_02794 [Segniliparus rugosus ATCC BAA-974]
MLVLGMSVSAACTKTVHGKASLPQNNTDLAHDPQITNIGVDTPVSTRKEGSSSSAGGSDATGSDLSDYLSEKRVAVAPVSAGQGLTVSVRTPSGWKPSQTNGASQQVSIVLPSDDGVYALMTVDVYRLSQTPPTAELIAAAKNSINAAGNLQTPNDTPYQGNPSTAGIVTVTTKKGSRVVEVIRYTFVQDASPSTTYLVESVIVCGTNNWESMRNDLLRLDSSMSFDN